MIISSHSNENVRRIFALKQKSFVLLSEDQIDPVNQYYQQKNIYVVDSIDSLSSPTLKIIFDTKAEGPVVLVNTIYDKKQFNTIMVDKVLNYFDKNNCFYTCIIYFDHDFPGKKFYKSTSTIVKVTDSPIQINNKGLLYIGQYGTSGYASAAKGYIADYVLKGVDISWQPLRFDDSSNDSTYYVDSLAESVINKNLNDKYLTIVHSTPDIWNQYIKDDGRYVGYCTWETNKLPDSWVDYINLAPEVWVPSQFNKECFINSGVKSQIEVVPHIWHPQPLFNKNDVYIKDYFDNDIPKDKYTYYCIGELNYRKGIEDLVKVFNRINNLHKDTQLILKIHYKGYSEKSIAYCIEKIKSLTDKLGTSIFLILSNLTNKEILGLHSFSDCYVSLNKGEGFGLTIFDAFHHGKDVIATGYSAPVEFLGKDHWGLVEYKIDKVSGMDAFNTNYSSDQEWGYPNLDHAYELMMQSYEKKYNIY